MPSPIEITKLATEVVSESVPRHLPNKGLVANQMIHAIHKLGLEVAHYRVEDAYVLRAYVSAYLRAQIPMVLIVDLFDHSPRVNRLLGRHAVAVTGYRIGNKLPTQRFENFVHSSSRITKIFAHDDQIGPFARMEFDEAHAGFPVLLRTSWTSESDGDRGSVSAIPKLLLIPLYHKIRIPYESVEEIVVDFNYVFRQRIRFLDRPLEWDIFLTTVNDFKERVRTTHYLTSQYRRVVLQEPMPHYLWIAMGKKVGGSPVIELVFDATDIEQGKLFLRAVEYDLNIYNLLDLDPSMTLSSRLRTHGGVLARMRGFEQSQLRHILRWFARQAT